MAETGFPYAARLLGIPQGAERSALQVAPAAGEEIVRGWKEYRDLDFVSLFVPMCIIKSDIEIKSYHREKYFEFILSARKMNSLRKESQLMTQVRA